MKNILLASALLASLGAAHAVTANLVVDGGFEDVFQPSGTFSTYSGINGWTTTGGPGIEIRNNVAGSAFEGGNFVELDSTANSAMSQTIATTAGLSYALTFEYSARGGIPAASNPIQVLWNGTSLATVTLDGVGQSGNVWQAYSFNVAGTGKDTLTFAAVGTSDSLGGSLDAVSLTAAVPEPSTYALMIGGLALVGVSLKKKRGAAR